MTGQQPTRWRPREVVSGDGLVVARADGPATGEPRPVERLVAWRQRSGELVEIWSQPSAADGHLVIAGDRIVVSSPASVTVLDATSGRQLERFDVDRISTVPPVVHDGLLVRVSSSVVTATDLEDGSTVWSRDLGERVTTAATLAGDAVLLGTAGRRLLALDVDDGEEAASVLLDGVPEGPVVAGHGRVITRLVDGTLVAFRHE